jgi:hypothetical protein
MLGTVEQGNMLEGRRRGRTEANYRKNIGLKKGEEEKVNSCTANGGRHLSYSEESRTDNWRREGTCFRNVYCGVGISA